MELKRFENLYLRILSGPPPGSSVLKLNPDSRNPDCHDLIEIALEPFVAFLIELKTLLQSIAMHFRVNNLQMLETAIEIDPRTVDVESVYELLDLGFNRMSFGIHHYELKTSNNIDIKSMIILK